MASWKGSNLTSKQSNFYFVHCSQSFWEFSGVIKDFDIRLWAWGEYIGNLGLKIWVSLFSRKFSWRISPTSVLRRTFRPQTPTATLMSSRSTSAATPSTTSVKIRRPATAVRTWSRPPRAASVENRRWVGRALYARRWCQSRLSQVWRQIKVGMESVGIHIS